ncbi:G patch domain and ankyrin repeat-containing protein 1 [Ambystoma mexicanum]|uniref:G patch domain and ankyrin repeat-containing protein 1 n=1 Tax=Ambystoma mexicanum TaxID=8296 RepID=UPI0037E9269B
MSHPQLITFTRAREDSDCWRNGQHRKERALRTEGTLHGDEARSFYESLLSNCSDSRRPTKRRTSLRKQQRAEIVSSLQTPASTLGEPSARSGHQMLKCAQDGDLKLLRQLVEKGKCDINFRDNYYWTAIMCAAYAGRLEVVRYLLQCGAAWVGVCETQGRDAMALAQEAGHSEVVRLLQQCQSIHKTEKIPRVQVPEKKYCEVCKAHYQEDSVEQHQRSTVHLFNKKENPVPTYYCIPEHNVGYKLMVKEGWDREAGLGPEGKGRKFPIQTILKRDQKGLGFQTDQKPKVTHFSAHDVEAVERQKAPPARTQRVATISKKEERRKEAKAKNWERDLRTYMDIDF